MPNDGVNHSERAGASGQRGVSSWFAVPAPLKRLFDRFPLTTYPSNHFPLSSRSTSEQHSLFIFTTSDDSTHGAPSFNPSCLRWQTYLKIRGIDFRTVASSNHASPTGALPFLVVVPRDGASQTVSTKSLRRWTTGQKSPPQEHEEPRYEAYLSLVDSRIRLAWLYQLYLCPANQPSVQRLYLASASSNPLVQLAISHQLKQAAEAELRKATFLRRKEEEELWREAGEAFFALSSLLGEKDWFFGENASEFDANVFAYTHLILDMKAMRWQANRLGDLLRKHANLIRHRDRILDLYY